MVAGRSRSKSWHTSSTADLTCDFRNLTNFFIDDLIYMYLLGNITSQASY
jgi:hypothetical protein